jgi:hypothetical protein
MTSNDISENKDQHNIRYKSNVSLPTELLANSSDKIVLEENNSNCKLIFLKLFLINTFYNSPLVLIKLSFMGI